jgi:hypothetical protein
MIAMCPSLGEALSAIQGSSDRAPHSVMASCRGRHFPFQRVVVASGIVMTSS